MPAQAKIDRLNAHRLSKKSNRQRKLTAGILLKRFLLFAFLLFALGLSWKIYSAWKNRIWDTDTRLTVAVAQENPTLYSYSPSSQELTIIVIPANTQVDAAGGYGSWLAGSLWDLGIQEKRRELLSFSLEKNLGVPVDGFIGLEGGFFFQTTPWPVKFFAALAGNFATNLTFFDRLALVFGPGSVPTPNRRIINLEGQGVITKAVLSDGQEGFIVVPERAKVIFEALRDDKILSEGKTLIITNATDKKGLAGDVVRVASTLGVRVIGAQTAGQKVEDCLVKTRLASKDSVSVKRLAKIFGCSQEIGEFEGHADIEIVLGEGFAKRF